MNHKKEREQWEQDIPVFDKIKTLVWKPGYMYRGQVIKPSLVKVAN